MGLEASLEGRGRNVAHRNECVRNEGQQGLSGGGKKLFFSKESIIFI